MHKGKLKQINQNSITLKEIRHLYGWSSATFYRRINKIPGFYDITKGHRILTPDQARLIFVFYGMPKGINLE